MASQAELILGVITLWFLVLSQFFRDGMGLFKQIGAQEPINTIYKTFKHLNDLLNIGGGINFSHYPSCWTTDHCYMFFFNFI